MEKQFFDWEECDEVEFGVMIFNECTLKCQIGKWKEDTVIPAISVDYANRKMRFFNEEEKQIDEFDLGLIIYYKVENTNA